MNYFQTVAAPLKTIVKLIVEQTLAVSCIGSAFMRHYILMRIYNHVNNKIGSIMTLA